MGICQSRPSHSHLLHKTNTTTSAFSSHISEDAAMYGTLDSLAKVHEDDGHSVDLFTARAAAASAIDSYYKLKYLHEKGCPWDIYVCYIAAERGDARSLRYALDNHCPWSRRLGSIAAKQDNSILLNMLIKDYRCPVDEDTVEAACLSGSLQCLELAHKHGGCLTALASSAAGYNGYVECFAYLMEHNCPLNLHTMFYDKALHQNFHGPVLQYIVKRVHNGPDLVTNWIKERRIFDPEQKKGSLHFVDHLVGSVEADASLWNPDDASDEILGVVE